MRGARGLASRRPQDRDPAHRPQPLAPHPHPLSPRIRRRLRPVTRCRRWPPRSSGGSRVCGGAVRGLTAWGREAVAHETRCRCRPWAPGVAHGRRGRDTDEPVHPCASDGAADMHEPSSGRWASSRRAGRPGPRLRGNTGACIVFVSQAKAGLSREASKQSLPQSTSRVSRPRRPGPGAQGPPLTGPGWEASDRWQGPERPGGVCLADCA